MSTQISGSKTPTGALRPVLAFGGILRALMVAVLLFGAAGFNASAALISMTGKSGYVAVMYGAAKDPKGDSQAGAADTDILGNTNHGSFYVAFDDNNTVSASDDTLVFRLRIDNPTSPTVFGGVAVVGMDANLDGKIDIFMQVDGRNSGQVVRLMDPGTDANISPNTTSTQPLPGGWLANNGVYPFSAQNYAATTVTNSSDPHWDGNNDIGPNGAADLFVTWRIPITDIATVLAKPSPQSGGVYGPRGATGIAGYTKDTLVAYVSFTQTQSGPINGDLNGVPKDYDKNASFSSLGVYTTPMSAANPVSASDFVLINEPIDANSLINATEDNTVVVTGTATASGWVRITITDTNASSIVTWVQANGSGAWTNAAQDLSAFAEGTLTFSADLVSGNGSNTLVPASTSDSATSVHDKVAPLITINSVATTGFPVISGTSSNVSVGATITVTVYPYGDGTSPVTYSAVVGSGGTWSVDTSVVYPSSGTPPSSGFTPYATVKADGTDAAGNPATTVTAVTQPTVNVLVTNDTTPTLTGTWGGINGGTDTLVVQVGGIYYTNGMGQLTVSGNTWTLNIPSALAVTTYSVETIVLRSGTPVANTTASALQIVTGPSISITSSSNQYTNKPTIFGTSTIVSGSIVLQLDLGNDGAPYILYSVNTSASGAWTNNTATNFPYSGTFPLNGYLGTVGVLATATDTNGAIATNAQTLSLLATPSLTITSIVSTATSDTNAVVNNADFYINRTEDNGLTISGTSTNATNLTVTISVSNGVTSTNHSSWTNVVQPNGSWAVSNIDLTGFADGRLVFTATVTGATATDTNYIHDTYVPIIAVTSTSTIDRNGTPGGFASGFTDLTNGTQIIVVFSTGSTKSNAVDTAGNWIVTNSSTMSAGAQTLTIYASSNATDLAGNRPAATNIFSFTAANLTQPPTNTLVIGTIAGDDIITQSESTNVFIFGTSTFATGTNIIVTVTNAVGQLLYSNQVTTVAGGNWTNGPLNFSTNTPNGPLLVTAYATTNGVTVRDVSLPTLMLGTIIGGSSSSFSLSITNVSAVTSLGDANISLLESTNVTFRGTSSATNNSMVYIKVTDTNGSFLIFSNLTVTSGSWASSGSNISSLAEGLLTVVATVTNGTTNTLDTTYVLLDKTAPKISITAGPSAGDSTPVITGTTDLPVGSTFTVGVDTDGNGTVDITYTVTVDIGGTWSIDTASDVPTTGTFPPGGLTANSVVSITVTDAAGNTSYVSSTSITSISSDLGTSSSDFITADSTLIFNGLAQTNSTVAIYTNGVFAANTTANGSGVWTFNDTGYIFSNSTNTLTAIATNAAGMTNVATQTFIVDLSPPSIAITQLTSDTGASSTDYTTYDQTLVFNGIAEANSAVTVMLTNASGIVFSNVVTSTGGGAWTLDKTATTLPDGTYTIIASVTDKAGNTSTAFAPLIIDTSSTISITTAAKTSDLTPEITGTSDFGSNRLVTVTISGATYTNLTGAGGNWSIDLGTATPSSGTLTPLTNGGVYTIGASGTDLAGNFATNSKSLTVDTAAPGIFLTTPIGDTNADNKVDANEDNSVVISGTTTNIPNGSTVSVYVTDGTTTLLFTTNIVTTNTWSIGTNNLSTLANGTITVTATYTDDFGNSYTDTATFNHDKSGVLTIDGITQDTGSSPTDFITMDNTLVFTGSTTPGGTVSLNLTNSVAGTNVFFTSVVADSGGVWTFVYTNVPLFTNATYTLIATNAGSTNTQSIVIDQVPPTGPVTVTAPGTTPDTTPTITGTVTLSPGETFTVTIDAITYTVGDGNLTTNGAGGWSLTIPPSNALTPATSGGGGFNGQYIITATITDVAGNTLSSTGTITIADTTSPVIDFAPANGASVDYTVTSLLGATVSIDDNSNPVTVVEASDQISLLTIQVGSFHNGASEKIFFGTNSLASDGSSGTQNDITVGGVRVNVSWTTNVFSIVRYDYTDLTSAEAQAILRDLQYTNSAPTVTQGARTLIFKSTDSAGNESASALVTIDVTGNADSVVHPATGGSSISADTAASVSGAFTTLSGPKLDEIGTGNISTGTIVLNAPPGFEFDSSSTVTVIATNSVMTGTVLTLASYSVTPTASTITINVSSASTGGAMATVIWTGIKVRPTVGTPLASGIITNSGTATITGITNTTSYGVLGEVVGAFAAYKVTAASGTVAAGSSDQLTLRQVDQFGSDVTNFTGDALLTFSGLGTSGAGNVSTVTDTNAVARTQGTALYVSFTNGVSSVGGLLVPYKAETATVNVTDGVQSSTSTGGSGATITVTAGTLAAYKVTAASGTVTAGNSDQLTIRQVDQYGNAVTTYTGDLSLTFSGLGNSPSGSIPTITDKTAATVNQGTTTTVSFTNGVSSVGGLLVPYKAETATVHVTDGTKSSTDTGGSGATITVNAGVLAAYKVTAASATVTAGNSDQLTIKQVDQYGNTVTTYTGDLGLTFSGLGGSPAGNGPTVTDKTAAPVAMTNSTTVSFTNGVSSVGGLLVPYKAETATVNVTDGTKSSTDTGGSGAAITVNAGTLAAYKVTAASGTVTAGNSDQLTIKQVDQYGNTVTTYTGDLGLTFSGLGGSPAGNGPTVTDKIPAAIAVTNSTTVSFTNGVSSAGGLLVPYKAETATVNVTDGTKSSTDTGGSGVTITVNAGALAAYKVTAASGTVTAGTSDQLTVRQVDQYGNTVTTFSGDLSLTFSGLGGSGSGSGPTVTDKDANVVAMTNSTPITFTSGVSTVGGLLVPYKAETATVNVTDGTKSSTDTGGSGATLTVTSATATKLVFVTQPNNAQVSTSFEQQPVIETQDDYGNKSTVGVGASLDITVTQTAGSGALSGTDTFNIGTGGGNGSITYTNLSIDTVGAGKQLTATPASGPLLAVASSLFDVWTVLMTSEDRVISDRGPYFSTGTIILNRKTGGTNQVMLITSVKDPYEIAMEANGDFLVVDSASYNGGALWRIDHLTLGLTKLSVSNLFRTPFGVKVMTKGTNAGTILVADLDAYSQAGAIFKVNPVTGAQSPLTIGTNFYFLQGMGIAPVGSPNYGDIYVNSVGNGGSITSKLIKVDPDTGAQTVITSGGNLNYPVGMIVEASGNIVVVDALAKKLIRINPGTGVQTVLSGSGVGAGPNFILPTFVWTDASGDFFVTDGKNGAGVGERLLLKIDKTTGDRTLVTSDGFFEQPRGIILIP